MIPRASISQLPQCLLLLAVLFCLLQTGESVKRENWKTCDQSGFCKRNRKYADDVSAQRESWKSPYRLEKPLQLKDGAATGTILKDVKGLAEPVELPITISFLESGTARVQVDETRRQNKDIEVRHGSPARKERYNEAAYWSLVGGLNKGTPEVTESGKDKTIIQFGPEKKFQATITHNPFSVDFLRDGEAHVQINSQGLFNVEHWRPKVEKPKEEPKEGEESTEKKEETPKEDGEDESTWWEETFGGNTDTKPRGPESIGLDITFPGYEQVIGLPEHASSLALKETRGQEGGYKEPYRMYNGDVFEYETNEPMTLYGSIPFMQAHRIDSTVGVFWLNGAETWVDIVKSESASNPKSLGKKSKDTHTHWFSEAGVMDLFVFLGPTPKDVVSSYAELTGHTALPQLFSIAYHQCRWNYVTDEDVKDVDRKFDRARIPYDIIWLDIEYTDGKKYFTWDPDNFKDPISMQKQLDASERKLVVIIDPHIKNEGNYHIVDELKSKDLAVHNKDQKIYDGWCWPGSSHWIDCFNPKAITWWKGLFQYSAFKDTMANTFLWNDMNEPSVFNGPETTMPKDNLHFDNWEHRDLHNINGMTFHNATYQALLARDKIPKRPFVLTRSFFAGSQRYGAMWTGDNQAKWDHLAISIPMVLSLGVSGFPFAGADVGGFFGNPSKELLTRWYQAGIWYPFFRAHAHIDTRRREPYMIGEPYTDIITQAVRLRYSLLPAWYTAFHQASVDGSPVVKPMYYEHPSDEQGFTIDDQLYLGNTGLLVKPVISEGGDHVDLYIPDSETYYDYFDFSLVSGAGRTHRIEAPLDKLPLFMQGGHIIPRKDRARRSSGLMKWDPYTLVVVLDSKGNAEGELYVDDGETFEYEEGANIHRKFSYDEASKSLKSENIGKAGKKTKEYLKTMARVKVEKVVVVAPPALWAGKTEVSVKESGAKDKKVLFEYHKSESGKAAWAVVKNPGVAIGADWTVVFA